MDITTEDEKISAQVGDIENLDPSVAPVFFEKQLNDDEIRPTIGSMKWDSFAEGVKKIMAVFSEDSLADLIAEGKQIVKERDLKNTVDVYKILEERYEKIVNGVLGKCWEQLNKFYADCDRYQKIDVNLFIDFIYMRQRSAEEDSETFRKRLDANRVLGEISSIVAQEKNAQTVLFANKLMSDSNSSIARKRILSNRPLANPVLHPVTDLLTLTCLENIDLVWPVSEVVNNGEEKVILVAIRLRELKQGVLPNGQETRLFQKYADAFNSEEGKIRIGQSFVGKTWRLSDGRDVLVIGATPADEPRALKIGYVLELSSGSLV